MKWDCETKTAEGTLIKKQFVGIIAVAILSVVYIYYIYKTYMNYIPINSDLSVMVLMADDILHGNIFLNDWIQSGISFLTTDLLYYLIAVACFGVSVKSYAFANALMYFCYVCTGIMVLSKIKNNYVKWCSIAFAIIFCAIPSEFQLNVSRVHMGVAPYLFVSLFLLSNICDKKPRKIYYILLFLCTFLGTYGDQLYLILAIVPIVIASVYGCVFDKCDKTKMGKILAAVLGGVCTSMVAERIYYSVGTCDKGSMLERNSFETLSGIGENFRCFIEGLLELFNSNFTGKKMLTLDTVFYFLEILILIFFVRIVFLTFSRILRQQESSYIQVVLCIGVVLVSAVMLLTTLNQDINTTRYFCYFPMVLIMIVGFWADDNVLAGKIMGRGSALSGRAVFYMICCLCILLTGGRVRARVQMEGGAAAQAELANVLVENNLEYGYGNFWDSASTTVIAKGKSHVLAILTDDTSAIAMEYYTNMSWFDNPANFVVVRENRIDSLSREQAEKMFGTPEKSLECGEYEVLIYPYDLSSVLKKSK